MTSRKKLLSELNLSKKQLKAEEKTLLVEDSKLKQLYFLRLVLGLLALTIARYIFSKAYPELPREISFLVGFGAVFLVTWALTIWLTNPALLGRLRARRVPNSENMGEQAVPPKSDRAGG